MRWNSQHTPIYKIAVKMKSSTPGHASRLLDERTSRLSEGVSNYVHGSLALGLLLGVQVDVRHLLARVEQRVLAALGQDVLVRLSSRPMCR